MENVLQSMKKIFKVEVLGMKVPLRVVETERTKSFICQLNLYGFTEMQRDFVGSPSSLALLAEEEVFAAHKKEPQLSLITKTFSSCILLTFSTNFSSSKSSPLHFLVTLLLSAIFIIEWFGLEWAFKTIWFQAPAIGSDTSL